MGMKHTLNGRRLEIALGTAMPTMLLQKKFVLRDSFVKHSHSIKITAAQNMVRHVFMRIEATY